MLNNATYEQLVKIKLFGMAAAFARQLEQTVSVEALSFEERFAQLVSSEITDRDDRRLRRLLQLAALRQDAAIEDVDFRADRGLDRSTFAALSTVEWVGRRQNLHVTGPTGTGKSWLACAFGNQTCRAGLSVKYERVPRLLESLRVSRGDGSYGKRLAALAKTDLLILDDFAIKPLVQAERHDLLEVIEDRHGRRSTLVTSQLPVKLWHEYLGDDPTVADALLDRLLSNSHRLELRGDSLRRQPASADNLTTKNKKE